MPKASYNVEGESVGIESGGRHRHGQRSHQDDNRTMGSKMKSGLSEFFGLVDPNDPSRKQWNHRIGDFSQRRSRGRSSRDTVDHGDAGEDVTDGPPKRYYKNEPIWKMVIGGMAGAFGKDRSRKPYKHSRSFKPSDVQHKDTPDAGHSAGEQSFKDKDLKEIENAGFFDGVDVDTVDGAGGDAGIARRDPRDSQWDDRRDWRWRERGDDIPRDQPSKFDRMADEFKDEVEDNSNRFVGFFKGLWDRGFLDSLLDAEYYDDKKPEKQDNYRPYFTFWVTFVQTIILIVAIGIFGIGTVGFTETVVSAEVQVSALYMAKESYKEADNFWIGPRQADLIHLGAKYSPCMRLDENVKAALDHDLKVENETACCVYNDGSGCVQTREKDCSKLLSNWNKWTPQKPGPDSRISGSVCGQDPRYCTKPTSQGAFKWKDDITQWPICKKSSNASNPDTDPHMSCEVTGRPCCIGIQGECTITTREHCTFLKGFFHEEAALCSQVNCMADVCGMFPFANPERPDQFYRIWTPLFLHAGIIHLLVSILFQLFEMRDVEKTIGWIRMAFIYIGSGITGNMASAVFLPYHVETGPAGAQLGILACHLVIYIKNWNNLYNPKRVIGFLVGAVVVLILIGFLPMIDNYAHIFGFLGGLFLTIGFVPFEEPTLSKRVITMIAGFVISIGLFVLMVIFFYVLPVYHCKGCEYFNCIPFTNTFCNSMEVKVRRMEL